MTLQVPSRGSEPNFRIYRGNSEAVGENWGPTPGVPKFELPGSDPGFRDCFHTWPTKVPKPGSDPFEEGLDHSIRRGCLLLGVKSILDPVDLIAAVNLALDQEGIEAQWLTGKLPSASDIEQGGFNDLALL